jgi:TRAP-type uncharacterized transport system fused permease subunit
MADLTPPVALAAFAASPIAKASGLRIGIQAVRIALAGYVIPFMAVYAPALMLQGGNAFDVVYIVLKALLAMGLWGIATIGHLFIPLGWPERILAVVAAFSLVVALPVTDQVGFGLCIVFFIVHWLRSRRSPA